MREPNARSGFKGGLVSCWTTGTPMVAILVVDPEIETTMLARYAALLAWLDNGLILALAQQGEATRYNG